MSARHVMIVFFNAENAKHGEWFDAGHSIGCFPPEKYIKVWEGDIEYEGPTHSLLNHLWNITQNDFVTGSWRGALTGWGIIDACRSSAVGDLFYVDGEWYKIAPVGFEHLADNVTVQDRTVDLAWQAWDFSKHFPTDGKYQLNSAEDVDRAVAKYRNGR